MSTFLLNPNDSLIINDSIVVKMTKATDACQTCVSETATNCNDVMIVLIICTAIILMVTIVAITISIWHTKEMQVRSEMEKEKYNREKEQRELSVKLEEQREKFKKDGYESRRIFDAKMEQEKDCYLKYLDFIEKIYAIAKNKDGYIDADMLSTIISSYEEYVNKNSKQPTSDEK